ncbi:MAG TPA: hypothetical protein VLV86_20985, partial [Vicinamibacterales bacterium]|nr:hypothetical protein [Vicinamibacterales bacterium]
MYLRALAPQPPGAAAVQLPQILVTSFLRAEIIREACTLVMLASIAWIASRRIRGFVGAFLLTFGIWDLVYYGVLRSIVGWP